MSSDSGKAPSGANQQGDETTKDFRIEDMAPAEGAPEQADSLRGGVINRGDGTLILADQWTGLTADDKNLA